MNLEQLKLLLRKSGYRDFSVKVNPVGPDNEWTEAEQEEDCCMPVPNHDPCVGDGKKVEPWYGWTDEEKQQTGFVPKGVSAQELLNRAEKIYGKGNVELKVRKVGPSPCGEKITNFVDTLSCCTDPAELLKSSGPTTVSPGDDFDISVVSGSGEGNITWDTIGTGITVAKDGDYSAHGTVDNCFCTPVIVYAQDTCGSVAPWVVSSSDGSWSTIVDESLSSPFGWLQDGVSSGFYVRGFNDDNTKVSIQHYWHDEYVGTKAMVCGTSMPGINTSPIVEPSELLGFEKCESSSIWVRLKEGYADVWEVRYAIDNQSTIEYTPGACEDELVYDEDNSGTVIADSSSVEVFWTGGQPPFDVETHGIELYLDSDKTTNQLRTSQQSAVIYSGDTCGYSWVQITDSCGVTVQGDLRGTDGEWVEHGRAAIRTWYVTQSDIIYTRVSNVTNFGETDEVDQYPWYAGKYVLSRPENSGYLPYLTPGRWVKVRGYITSCTPEEAAEIEFTDPWVGAFTWNGISPTGAATNNDGQCPGAYLNSSSRVPYFYPDSTFFGVWEWVC